MTNEYFEKDASPVTVSQPAHRKKPTRNIILAGVAILVILLGAGALLLKNSDTQNNTSNTKSIEVAKIYITKDGFVPSNLQVSENTLVTWTNQSATTHTVTVKEGTSTTASGTETLAPGESYSITAGDADTYHFDSPASGQKFQGVIMVTNKESENE